MLEWARDSGDASQPAALPQASGLRRRLCRRWVHAVNGDAASGGPFAHVKPKGAQLLQHGPCHHRMNRAGAEPAPIYSSAYFCRWPADRRETPPPIDILHCRSSECWKHLPRPGGSLLTLWVQVENAFEPHIRCCRFATGCQTTVIEAVHLVPPLIP